MQLGRICSDACVREADSYATANQLVEQDPPHFLILDLMMPGQHWQHELPGLIARLRPGRCVVLSAVENPAEIASAMELGLAGFIPKRSEPKIIAHALRLIFDGGVYVPPEYMAYGGTQPAKARDQTEPAGRLTPRQLDVLRGICAGYSNKQIAYELTMSEATVKQHVNAVLKALSVHNRTEAAMAAQRFALIEPV